MRVRVLGQVELVDDDGSSRAVGGRNQRLVLAVLVSRAGDMVDADRLVDALWPDDPPRTARHSLRTYVSRLRRHLGDALTIGPGGYTLAASAGTIDMLEFERLVKEAAALRGVEAVTVLDQAMALWRGQPFGDLAHEELLRASTVRLDELYAAGRERRALALLEAGRPSEAAIAAEEVVADDPLREGAWVALVEALAAADRAADALRAYQRAVAALAEVGLEPARRLRDAETAALADAAPSSRSSTAGQPAPAALGPSRLPVSPSTMVGRSAELDALERLLGSARLLTITGPGGVGKTRLALELANRVASRCEWGAVLVELARLDDPAAVAPTVLDALGLDLRAGSGAPIDALAAAGDLDVLVVLDNCEHVLDATVAVADALLRGGGRARILATSRERLDAGGEHVWPLAPLPVDGDDDDDDRDGRPTSHDASAGDRDRDRDHRHEVGSRGAPACELFVDRARAVRPDLALDESDLAAIARIVRRVDGLPLAIEMAAARAASLPLPALADHLDHELGPALTRRTGEARHRTLRAVVEWSEALLEPDERAFFAELSVFPGVAAVDDVAAVTGRRAPLDMLCRLADRSLLVPAPPGDRAAFGMLSVIREHARARLEESGRSAAVVRRHARHTLARVEVAAAQLRTPDERAAVAAIEALVDDARSVHTWAREHDLDLAITLSAALHVFCHASLREEPLAWAGELVELVEISGHGRDRPTWPELALVLGSAVQRQINGGRLDDARRLALRGVAAAGTDADARALLSSLHADVELFAGRLDDAADHAEAALAASAESRDPHGRVMALVNVVLANHYRGDDDRAAEALALGRELELDRPLSPSDAGWLAYVEGEVALEHDPSLALEALDRAVTLADSVGNRYLGGVARVSAWSVRARAGAPADAVRELRVLVAYWRRQQAAKYLLTTLRTSVSLLRRLGAAIEAAELIGAVASDAVAPLYGREAEELEVAKAWVVDRLGPDRAAEHIEVGAARSLDGAAVAMLAWAERSADGAASLQTRFWRHWLPPLESQ